MTSKQKELILNLLNKEASLHRSKLNKLDRTINLYNEQLGTNITQDDIEHIELKIDNTIDKLEEVLLTIKEVNKL